MESIQPGIAVVTGASRGVGRGVAEALGAGYISSLYRDGIAYAVLIAVILFKPTGFLGKSVRQKA